MAACLRHSLTLPFPPNPGRRRRPAAPAITVTANPSQLDLIHLRSLFLSSNYSPLRFPDTDPDGIVAPVDLERLRLAVSNSSVVVSAFEGEDELGLGGLVGRMVGKSEGDRRLVGFGRAVSDGALTASIHDVVVVNVK